MNILKKHPILGGLALIFLFTWPIDLLVTFRSFGWIDFDIPLPIALSVGYGFVIAVLIMTRLTRGKKGIIGLLQRFLLWRVDWRWYLTLLIIPIISFLALALNFLIFGTLINLKDALAYQLFGPSVNLFYIILPWFVFTSLTNMEEIGWRGYILPRLQKRYSALVSALIVGAVWGFWHFPKYLAGGLFIFFLLAIIDAIAKSILLVWLYNNTRGSLLLPTLFHSSINTAAIIFPVANTVTGGNLRAYMIMIILEIITALALILYFGPEKLSRKFEKQT